MVGTRDHGIPHDPAGRSCVAAEAAVSTEVIEAEPDELVEPPREASHTSRGVSEDELASDASVSGVVDTMTMDDPCSE